MKPRWKDSAGGRSRCEALESRTLLHGVGDGVVYPLGAVVPWTISPISVALTDPITSPPPTSPPVTSPPTSAIPAVTGVVLVDADSDSDIGPFADGARIDLTTGGYAVRVETSGDVGSVAFLLDGILAGTDNTAPFTVVPLNGGDYSPWSVSAGSHTLTVVPYSGDNATGTSGDETLVSFTVVDGGISPPTSPPPASPPPTSPPTTPPPPVSPPPVSPPPVSPPPPTSPPIAAFTSIAYSNRKASPIIRAESLRGVYNGRLYVFGGFSGSLGPVADSHYYDPAANTWTPIKSTPEAITHAGVAQTAEDVYFVGGYVGTGDGYNQIFGSSKVWKYNFATDTYSRITDLPKKYAGGGAEIVNGTLHYFGGYNPNRTDTDIHLTLDLTDPSAKWQDAPKMLTSRNHMGHVEFGGKIYAIAGQTGTDEGLVVQTNVEVFDPATGAWTAVAPMPKGASHVSSATFVMGDRIIVMGGESAHNQQVREVFAYTPATDTWQALTPLPAARFSGVASAFDGKIVFTTGGSAANTWLGTPVFA